MAAAYGSNACRMSNAVCQRASRALESDFMTVSLSARHVASQLAEIWWRRVLLHVEHRRRTGRRKGRPAHQGLEEHHAQRIEIGPAVDVGRAACLLGTHVFLGSDNETAARHTVLP